MQKYSRITSSINLSEIHGGFLSIFVLKARSWDTLFIQSTPFLTYISHQSTGLFLADPLLLGADDSMTKDQSNPTNHPTKTNNSLAPAIQISWAIRELPVRTKYIHLASCNTLPRNNLSNLREQHEANVYMNIHMNRREVSCYIQLMYPCVMYTRVKKLRRLSKQIFVNFKMVGPYQMYPDILP